VQWQRHQVAEPEAALGAGWQEIREVRDQQMAAVVSQHRVEPDMHVIALRLAVLAGQVLEHHLLGQREEGAIRVRQVPVERVGLGRAPTDPSGTTDPASGIDILAPAEPVPEQSDLRVDRRVRGDRTHVIHGRPSRARCSRSSLSLVQQLYSRATGVRIDARSPQHLH